MNLILITIKILHILITLYIIFSPYIVEYIINDKKMKIMLYLLYIVFSISLVVHWKANNDVCCLSLTENLLTGKPMNETFIGRIISPFYTLNRTQVKELSYFVLFINNIFTINMMYKYRNLLDKNFLRYKE